AGAAPVAAAHAGGALARAASFQRFPDMEVRLLDLDGSVAGQSLPARRFGLREWGPLLRLACGWDAFARFEIDLARRLGSTRDEPGLLSFVGSGDFHHLSLALLKRQRRPFNLLVLDNHPDWMRHVPLLHCGTWLWHAARLPLVRRVFHLGGDADFDNRYRPFAPWPLLRQGKIVVMPARRCFRGWGEVPCEPLRAQPDEPFSLVRLERLLWPWREELAAHPLYVSLDRDVIAEPESASNWDHGPLSADEVLRVLGHCLGTAPSLAGMDVVGDWSAVQASGGLRTLLHWAEHGSKDMDAARARRLNEPFNLAVIEAVGVSGHRSRPAP
ncbi:MAG: hypothetical protein K2W96_10935, partial [Gemmataceae bacterium]|nr:hypothetical protein [Gemmataceae bacterium]